MIPRDGDGRYERNGGPVLVHCTKAAKLGVQLYSSGFGRFPIFSRANVRVNNGRSFSRLRVVQPGLWESHALWQLPEEHHH
eukprot:6198355-Pleurochrysis_carterae.AAC.1